MIREYRSISQIAWPLMTVRGVRGVSCGEAAELELESGEIRPCFVLETAEDTAVLLLSGQPDGLRVQGSRVRFPGRAPQLGVSEDLLGRIFSGLGAPIDGGPAVIPDALRDVGGVPGNPLLRVCPSEPIGIEISGQPLTSPLLRGQTRQMVFPLGQPYAETAAEIVRQAALQGGEDETAIVFAAVGMRFADYETVLQTLRQAGLAERTAVFANLAEDPVFERLLTPQLAMTAAEYFAFDREMDVVVLLGDMAAYAEALRELDAARGVSPGQWGQSPALRDSFAALYERAGLRQNSAGSITLLPVLTLPEDVGAHPAASVTAALAEGLLTHAADGHTGVETAAATQENTENM